MTALRDVPRFSKSWQNRKSTILFLRESQNYCTRIRDHQSSLRLSGINPRRQVCSILAATSSILENRGILSIPLCECSNSTIHLGKCGICAIYRGEYVGPMDVAWDVTDRTILDYWWLVDVRQSALWFISGPECFVNDDLELQFQLQKQFVLFLILSRMWERLMWGKVSRSCHWSCSEMKETGYLREQRIINSLFLASPWIMRPDTAAFVGIVGYRAYFGCRHVLSLLFFLFSTKLIKRLHRV